MKTKNRRSAIALLLVSAAAIVAPAAAHTNHVLHTKRQAEGNVLKAVLAAAVGDRTIKLTRNTRASCLGAAGFQVWAKYNHFLCTVRPFNGRTMLLRYHAKPANGYEIEVLR
jgi:hypothetical protein